ncbi:SseB family protein [Pukyongiella litopenaei]|uniref:SseB family protein n=1 Tax=Pukyongiella litopenaei TaxID=2605946 RepID=A0A2S0MVA5_9RHOB|nr:SseB family protein [Pukyongiella litopenaei]AVO39818.1 SseB family protein [Pukyongiella litopenaei]
MQDETPLDAAHAAMVADEADDTARLRFYDRLADAELFLLLTGEPDGDDITPELFDTGEGRFALGFDRAERLAEFTGRPAPYAALSGRVLAGLLAGQGIGLALNPEVAPSSMLLPAAALGWLRDTLDQGPGTVEAWIAAFTPPAGLPPALLAALDAKLATAAGLARAAWLVGVEYAGGGRGHLLGFVDAVEGAQTALAGAVSEALVFSGLEAGMLDVGFFAADDPAAARMAGPGLRFDLPEPEPPARPSTPGSDPDRPPILR